MWALEQMIAMTRWQNQPDVYVGVSSRNSNQIHEGIASRQNAQKQHDPW